MDGAQRRVAIASAAHDAVADPFDARRARHAPGLLRAFNDAGVLVAADVHVALRLAALGGETDEQVVLAAALAVRAPRVGHVLVDLAHDPRDRHRRVRRPRGAPARPRRAPVAAAGRVDRARGREPARGRRRGRRRRPAAAARRQRALPRPLLARGAAGGRRPAGARRGRAGRRSGSSDLADGLARLFAGHGDDRQRLAAAAAVLRRLAVVAGGPGTGKTTTVARIVALLAEQAPARAARGARGADRARPRRGSRRRCTPRRATLDVDAERARAAARAARPHAAPPARPPPRQPQPLPPSPRQPAPARRRDRRRDLDGLARR